MTKLIPMEDLHEAYEIDEGLEELHRRRHQYAERGEIEIQCRDCPDFIVAKSDAPELFAALDLVLAKHITRSEAVLRKMGIEPSKWTPPKPASLPSPIMPPTE